MYDGSPLEPDRNGPAISYEAADQRTAEPVSVTLIPTESIDPNERQQFEDNVSVAQKLRHANIAKVLDFGQEGDDYVYVSEHLAGETLASWVRSHGPMPVDASLRVGEQIVSVLSSAGFHKLPYPSIQSSDIVLVPGQTAEGTWPLVKLTNFGLPSLRPLAGASPVEPETAASVPAAGQIGNDLFGQPTTDIGSEIYSLGVTLYFLLTGVALSTEALQRGPKLSGFPKPLRNLLGRLLHRDAEQRPKDLLNVTEMIRQCSEKIERRRAFSTRYGIPLRTSIPGRREARPRRLVRSALAAGVLLLLAAAIAPIVLPESVGRIIGVIRKSKPVGVLVGVPESPAPPGAQAPQSAATTTAAAVATSQRVNPTIAPQAGTQAATTPNPFHVSPADVDQARLANAQPPAAPRSDRAENAPEATPDTSGSQLDTNGAAQANAERPPTTVSQSSSQTKQKSATSKSRHARAGQSSGNASGGRGGFVRARVIGITSDGRLIMRLPSGRTAIVAPDEESSAQPRHRSRVFIDRDQSFGLPPGFGPDYFPGD